MEEQSYDPIVPVKVENRRASARSGHGIHWREGGNKRTNLPKGNIVEAQTSVAMSTQIDRPTERTTMDVERVRGVTPEEPTAGNLHGGVCEVGDVSEAMVNLNAHEAGNGGESQGKPKAHCVLLYSDRPRKA